MTNRAFVVALTAIIIIGVVLAFRGPFVGTWWLVAQFTAVIAVTGAFGGLVHGLLAQNRARYTVVLPHRGQPVEERDIGIWGDVIVGAAAGTTLFLVIDTLFGLKIAEAGQDAQVSLKIVALGVLSGYLGMTVLENLSVMFSKRLTNAQIELDKTLDDAQKLREQLASSSRARRLIPLGDAYRRWEMWTDALSLYDEAIAIEPTCAEHYLQKSFVYADQAENALKEAADAAAANEARSTAVRKAQAMYELAIPLANKAIALDPTCARAYYDRACYRHRIDAAGHRKAVFEDLATAFRLDDTMRRMGRSDPDLRDLRHSDPEFGELVGLAVGANARAAASPEGPPAAIAPVVARSANPREAKLVT